MRCVGVGFEEKRKLEQKSCLDGYDIVGSWESRDRSVVTILADLEVKVFLHLMSAEIPNSGRGPRMMNHSSLASLSSFQTPLKVAG